MPPGLSVMKKPLPQGRGGSEGPDKIGADDGDDTGTAGQANDLLLAEPLQ